MNSRFKLCDLSAVPVRSRPKQQSEMTTQVLFGECVEVLEDYKDWQLIRCVWDDYTGWIDRQQMMPISSPPEGALFKTFEYLEPMQREDNFYLLPMGSTLYDFDGLRARFWSEWCDFRGRAVPVGTMSPAGDQVLDIARRYLHVPYLWGGRSPMGLDCSGFVQIVLSFVGIDLPRDAHQQAGVGELVHFLRLAQPGDVAFFTSERQSRRISHVGILIDDLTIIHASGQVRIDEINEDGIYRDIHSGYTHYLKLIRRVLTSPTDSPQ